MKIKNWSSRKGFYLVSPFLGFFFFLIAMSMTMVVVSENDQQISSAKASETHSLVFTTYAIQADAFDVFFQNYLQGVLDNYEVGNSQAIRTEIETQVKSAMSTDLDQTYTDVYENAFGIDCAASGTAYSLVILKFNSMGVDVLGTGRIFDSDQVTALWPYVSRYYLSCSVDEPPLDVSTDFRSRWYYLDANCICCQELGYPACNLQQPATKVRPSCPFCATP